MVDNKEGNFTLKFSDWKTEKNNLASRARFHLITIYCICFLRQHKKSKIPS